MKKQVLGMTISTFSALLYLTGLISPIIFILLFGYVFLVEDDVNLKKHATRAFVILFGFYAAMTVIDLVLVLMETLSSLVRIFDGSISYGFISDLAIFLKDALKLGQHIALIMLAFGAYTNKKVNVPGLDKIEKNLMDEEK